SRVGMSRLAACHGARRGGTPPCPCRYSPHPHGLITTSVRSPPAPRPIPRQMLHRDALGHPRRQSLFLDQIIDEAFLMPHTRRNGTQAAGQRRVGLADGVGDLDQFGVVGHVATPNIQMMTDAVVNATSAASGS